MFFYIINQCIVLSYLEKEGLQTLFLSVPDVTIPVHLRQEIQIFLTIPKITHKDVLPILHQFSSHNGNQHVVISMYEISA